MDNAVIPNNPLTAPRSPAADSILPVGRWESTPPGQECIFPALPLHGLIVFSNGFLVLPALFGLKVLVNLTFAFCRRNGLSPLEFEGKALPFNIL